MPTRDLRDYLRLRTARERPGRLLEAARAAMTVSERRAFDQVRNTAQLPSEEPKEPRAGAVPAEIASG